MRLFYESLGVDYNKMLNKLRNRYNRMHFECKDHTNKKGYFIKRRVDKAGIPIEVKFTLNQYIDIWLQSGHAHKIGTKNGQYCMSRYNDLGHYEIGNVFIQLHSQNSSDAQTGKTTALKGKSAHNKGVPMFAEQKAKLSAANKGRKLITNGLINRWLFKDEPLPDGFRYVRTRS